MSEIDYKTAYETVLEANKTYYKEIERLNNELKLYKDNHKHLINLLEQKENIINEAIKYIEKEMFMYDNIEAEREDLLKILKGDNE